MHLECFVAVAIPMMKHRQQIGLPLVYGYQKCMRC